MKIKVHQSVMIDKEDLHEHGSNSNRQDKFVFAQLCESIEVNGFDESLIVVPRGDGGYTVLSGNHRFRAGSAVGMTEFPCVIRDDWDSVKAEIESVRRNYVRGAIDKEAFTLQVDALSKEADLDFDDIYMQMGFEDATKFSQLYDKERELEEEMAKKVMETSTSAQAVKMIDDIGNIVSTILAEHGHTVPHSFLIFPAGKKTHLYVAANPALKATIQAIAEQAVAQRLDLNVALSGLLAIGMAQTSFLQGNGSEEITEGSEEFTDSSDVEFEGV